MNPAADLCRKRAKLLQRLVQLIYALRVVENFSRVGPCNYDMGAGVKALNDSQNVADPLERIPPRDLRHHWGINGHRAVLPDPASRTDRTSRGVRADRLQVFCDVGGVQRNVFWRIRIDRRVDDQHPGDLCSLEESGFGDKGCINGAQVVGKKVPQCVRYVRGAANRTDVAMPVHRNAALRGPDGESESLRVMQHQDVILANLGLE